MITGAQYLQNNTTHFSVWAPQKETMLLHIVHPAEQELNMQKDKEGYFHVTAENVPPGSRYFFMPDGKKDFRPRARLNLLFRTWTIWQIPASMPLN
jgi:maltooligosyltrehalose trehalohydrolase